MTLPLVIAPDAKLKQVSLPVKTVDNSVRELLNEMIATMYAEDGIGLAAVQIGVHKRLIVVDIMHDQNKTQPLYIVNPQITWQSDELSSFEEGCLSFPEERGLVRRPARISLAYLDYNGNECMMNADGLLATCIQHEIDHLNGITFVDHLSRLKRDSIMKRLTKRRKC